MEKAAGYSKNHIFAKTISSLLRKNYYLLLYAFLTSCSTVKVSYDYDKTVNFNKFKTYAYT